jgi:hypothetical protein
MAQPRPTATSVGTAHARKPFVTVLIFLTVLVVLSAIVVLVSEPSPLQRAFTRRAFYVGAPIVYRRQEVSTRPEPDAFDIYPATRGEFYYYSVLNYLRVTKVLHDGRIIAVASDKKRLCLWPNDSCLRKARLTERFIYRSRFPTLG